MIVAFSSCAFRTVGRSGLGNGIIVERGLELCASFCEE